MPVRLKTQHLMEKHIAFPMWGERVTGSRNSAQIGTDCADKF